MSKHHEKAMIDLQRLLATQDFKSEKELKDFMNSIVGNQIPSFPEETLTNEEKAIDLVLEAYNQEPQIGLEYIADALELDTDCIEAYEFLGCCYDFPAIATAFFEKGIQIGRKKFGGEYLRNNKGHFWGLHETRAFMRCLQFYSDCLYQTNKVHDSIEVLEELIELNPNDNQGVRDQLLLYSIEVGDKAKFIKYQKKFKNDFMTFAAFNKALFAFINEGESKSAERLLTNAISINKHVAKKLLSKQDVIYNSDGYILGSEDEADYYASQAKKIWKSNPEALNWLKNKIKKTK
jgi:tetratricopeptide (TPR) repeat protein